MLKDRIIYKIYKGEDLVAEFEDYHKASEFAGVSETTFFVRLRDGKETKTGYRFEKIETGEKVEVERPVIDFSMELTCSCCHKKFTITSPMSKRKKYCSKYCSNKMHERHKASKSNQRKKIKAEMDSLVKPKESLSQYNKKARNNHLTYGKQSERDLAFFHKW